MVKSNPYFSDLRREYIFPIIEKKLHDLKHSTNQEIINVGIGDIALPLSPVIAQAIILGVEEMTKLTSMRGYGPSEGYPFLQQAILNHEYPFLGLQQEEIFISDGINSEISHVLELFHPEITVAVPDPAYPVYQDSAILAGKTILPLPCLESNRCLPLPPSFPVNILYLCSPHNPTGEAFTYEELNAFVKYAIDHNALILYDNAYAAFVRDPKTPKTIYEIPEAKKVAIEFKSFSKTAGFTGLRCGYTIVPKDIELDGHPLWNLWKKRQSMKSNGVSFPIQKGAEACFSKEGQKEITSQIDSYLASAGKFRQGLSEMGYTCYGGINAPYVWWKIPSDWTSWQFFDMLLEKCHIVAIPGNGFGPQGEGFIRLSGFTPLHKVETALQRIQTI